MSQTPSILLERDKSQLEPNAGPAPAPASVVQLELNVIGVNDAVFDVPPVVVVEQTLLQSPAYSGKVVRHSCRWCPRGSC